MARRRDDYEGSWLNRFRTWLSQGDDRLDTALAAVYDDETSMESRWRVEEEAALREAAAEQRRREELRAEAATYERVRSLRAGNTLALRVLYLVAAAALCAGIIVLLLETAAALPRFGDAGNPANNEVPARYIEQGMSETGAVNIVAGMILDYRAFDTLGESNVLFAAVSTVLLLMLVCRGEHGSQARQLAMDTDDRLHEPRGDLILQRVSALIVPLVLLFGAYVILNGHLSPGGGFSGGSVMGAALILYANAFGLEETDRFFTMRTFRVVSVGALSFYALAKAYSFFCGANGLETFITPGTPGRIFSAGLIPYLNIAVGLVVCCTMYGIYSLFRRGEV